jgi:hypothetical protein
MPNMRPHFEALLKKINPPPERVALASTRVGDVREWLREQEFETRDPHTRLSGSYGRQTAIELIPDVDVLLFVPENEEQRTPNAVLRELHGVLNDYPNAGTVDLRGQRRSVRLELRDDELCLDIVPAISKDGLDYALLVPDRPQEEWIASDPLGYAERLTDVNQGNGGKLVPLIKLMKVWRDEQMLQRKPKSYVLEVILLYAVEDGGLVLCERSWAQNVHDAFAYIADKYADLMDNGSQAPRIPDPQISNTYITKGWAREHFETFMRRAREAQRAAERALTANVARPGRCAPEPWMRTWCCSTRCFVGQPRSESQTGNGGSRRTRWPAFGGHGSPTRSGLSPRGSGSSRPAKRYGRWRTPRPTSETGSAGSRSSWRWCSPKAPAGG